MQVPGAATVSHHMRAALHVAPTRPALWLGLRIALVIAAPVLLASVLDPVTVTWASLVGYSAALVDKGGAYRQRAESMAAVGIGSLVVVPLGMLVAGHRIPVVLVVTAGATLCAFAQAWGPARASVGNTIAIHLIVAAFLPLGTRIVPALLGIALGAGWAMVLALVVWPIRVYKPGRRAVSATLDALASYAAALAASSGPATAPGGDGDPDARDRLARFHRATRTCLEIARDTLVGVRRGRRGESGRGERLLAIMHACDHAFGGLIALEELLDAGVAVEPAQETANRAATLARLAAALHDLAERVLLEVIRPPATGAPLELTAEPAAEVPLDPVAHPGGPSAQPWTAAHAAHVRMMLTRVLRDQRRIDGLVDSLADDTQPVEDPGQSARMAIAVEDSAGAEGPTLLERLRAELNFNSAIFRHGLRVAICVGISSLIAADLKLARGYWIVFTSFILLQPARAATTTRAIQRGLGTVVGGVLAAVIAWAVRDPHLLMVIIILFGGIGASVLAVNYALYALFLTPTFVLLAEVHTQDFTIVRIRVLYTLLAGAIAFLASALLWPAREQEAFGDQMARALRALARYVEAVHSAVIGNVPLGSSEAIAARRAFGVAINNAELALDRVIADRAPAAIVEPAMSLAAAARRLGSTITVLGSSRAIAPSLAQDSALATVTRRACLQLEALAGAVEQHSLPPPPPPLDVAFGDPLAAARWARVEAQLVLVTQATARAAVVSTRPLQATGTMELTPPRGRG